ncbi:PREDICTED: pectinesterase 3 [Fragaria vesca subsp. vesca]|uniref:Pectinesterase n=1 Tax=Fragaria vesca TaxID=57918 RepID=A0A5P8U391_FRAVE|nr:PREDICTED: pectinesterase 3 [Fragaria vesca subsp. vesca]QFS21775.1 PME38 [Fragaria vesca]
MDSMTSFKGYGKVDELEEQAFRRKTRKRFIIVIVSIIVLVAVIIGAVTGTVIHNRNSSSSPSPTEPATQLTPSSSLKAVCDVTLYPNSCFSSISSLKNSNTTDPEALFKLSLHVAIDEVSKLKDLPSKLKSKIGNDTKLNEAFKVCETLFDDAVDKLNDSLSSMEIGSSDKLLSQTKINDLKTWITASMTDQDTCLDSLEELNSTLVQEFRDAMQNSTEYASNSLAIVAKILDLLSRMGIPVHRRLLGYEESSVPEFPGWVSPGDRRLLQEQNLTAHVTVAQDGTGDFKTIQEAVNAVPKKNLTRFVIYVKQGTYLENVIMDKNKWNVMMYGDGKAKTIVSGKLNFVDGTATFNTATFAVAGKGFIAKDMGFINTAGAAKHQAVAFRSGSDQSVYYRCSFDAFQDTLYAHSNRQFYRDCDITGTIDFIFGNAAVVFQNCNIQPRQPMPNQFNTITAQGKKDPNQNSGISIQKCTIFPLESNMTAQTYLGRPWKEFSTTIFMQSTIGSILNPLGWIEWVSNVDPPSTIFYAEYQNSGPGSSVDKRVTWAGYRPSLTDVEAAKFTVESFIQGSEWLPQTNVNFETSL